jgi:hypothetical protein
VNREDRELLVDLARLNGDMAALGLRIMEGSAAAAEQVHYAQRLIAAGERLNRRARTVDAAADDGSMTTGRSITLPENTMNPDWQS